MKASVLEKRRERELEAERLEREREAWPGAHFFRVQVSESIGARIVSEEAGWRRSRDAAVDSLAAALERMGKVLAANLTLPVNGETQYLTVRVNLYPDRTP